MATPTIRPKDLPVVVSTTAGDKVIIDGATTRSITVANLFSSYRGPLSPTQVFVGSNAPSADDSAIIVCRGLVPSQGLLNSHAFRDETAAFQNVGATFTGTGAGTHLTVTGVTGFIAVDPTGSLQTAIAGVGVPGATRILSQDSGTPGGAGVYVTNNATTSVGAAITATGFSGYASFDCNVVINGTCTTPANHFHAFQSRPIFSSTGNGGELASFWHGPVVSSGLIPSLYALKVTNAQIIGGAAVTSQYAVHSDTLSGAANNFFLWGGVNPSQFNDSVSIGSASGNALTIGPFGANNPVFRVDASVASTATGILVTGRAAASGASLSVISSGANENLTIDAKGSGTVTIGGTSTGSIIHTRATTLSAALTYGGVTFANTVSGPSGGSLISGSQGGAWTPTDASGAALTFTGVSAQWSRVGNMIFAYATLTYPVTASGANAIIDGLPLATANTQYGRQCLLTRSSTSGVSFILPSQNSTQIEPRNNAGVNVANSVLSAQSMHFTAIYPAA